jgi:hypothetical protein
MKKKKKKTEFTKEKEEDPIQEKIYTAFKTLLRHGCGECHVIKEGNYYCGRAVN